MILIVDDNVRNCEALAAAAKREAPGEPIAVLQVIERSFVTPDVPAGVILLPAADSQAAAVRAMEDYCGAAKDRIVVFYDVQLLGVQESDTAAAESPCTAFLRQLVKKRPSTFVNVHSSSLATREIAKAIDPTLSRVFWHDSLTSRLRGGSPSDAREIVRVTLERADSDSH